jgi:hypothetical protein
MVATTKNAVFWDVMPCGFCQNRRFGGTYCLYHKGDKNQQDILFLHSVQRLIVTVDIPSSQIIVTLLATEMSVLTRTTWHNIPEDSILHHPLILQIYSLHSAASFP